MARMKLTAAGPEGLRVNERGTCCARGSVVVGAFERIVFPIETRFLSFLTRPPRQSFLSSAFLLHVVCLRGVGWGGVGEVFGLHGSMRPRQRLLLSPPTLFTLHLLFHLRVE